jgi:hypothetical protein
MDNNFQFIIIDKNNIAKYYIKLLKNFNYHYDLHRFEREEGLLKEILKNIKKSKTILYLLTKNDKYVGFVSLSAFTIDESPSIKIDYLFVDSLYRGKKFLQLNNITVSKYLLLFAISKSRELKKIIGIRYITIIPDNIKLVNYYKNLNLNFKVFNKNYMILILDKK